MLPGSDQRRQRADRADRLPAAGVTLERHTEADDGRLCGGELLGERPDVRRFDAGDPLDIVGRELGRAGFQLLEAVSVLLDIVAIDQSLRDDRIDDAHRQSAVGARPRADMPVAGLGRARTVAVDDHHLGAALLCLEHERPMMQIGRDGVARPDDDELGMHEAFRVDPAGRADRQEPGGRRAGRAEGLLVHRGAEAIEERIAGVDALHQAHIAEIGIGHDRLAAIGGDDLAPAPADLGDRLVPGDPLELLGAFRPGPAQRIFQPVGIGVMIVEVLQLHAQRAARHRVILVASHLDELAVLHLVDHGASVRAVMRTGAKEGLSFRLNIHARTLPRAYASLGRLI